MAIIADLPVLDATDTVYDIAQALVAEVIPQAYADDAFHVAVAAFHGVDYLVTWNCKHIANAELWKKISSIVEKFGCSIPIICTPEELLGREDLP
jgi:predicted nucleic acid-binding protein